MPGRDRTGSIKYGKTETTIGDEQDHTLTNESDEDDELRINLN